jgi:hypothetical protein
MWVVATHESRASPKKLCNNQVAYIAGIYGCGEKVSDQTSINRKKIIMKRSALCLVDTEAQADAIVGKLRSTGFSDNDISVLFSDKESTRDFAHKKETKMPEGATVGASTGGVVGGTIGLLAGIGALAIPGLGPFIAAGPIVAALSGGAIGAGIGGLTGALVGLGIPEYEAKRYEGKVKEGGILISVHSESNDETKRAKHIFKEAGAHDISSTGESHSDVDNPPISAAEEVQSEAPASQSNSDADALSPQYHIKQTVQRANEGPAEVDERGPSYDAAAPTRPPQEEVAVRAYELFLRRGSSPGHETEDWLHAEKELVEEYNSSK